MILEVLFGQNVEPSPKCVLKLFVILFLISLLSAWIEAHEYLFI